MKKVFLSLLFILSIAYTSCKKNDDSPGEIYGKWRLTETLSDPGDGSGKYIKVKGDPKYITFEQSGKVSGDAISDLTTFKVLDSVRIELRTKTYNQPLVYYYKATARTLRLNPPCI